jgi:hypothetical protein
VLIRNGREDYSWIHPYGSPGNLLPATLRYNTFLYTDNSNIRDGTIIAYRSINNLQIKDGEVTYEAGCD